MEGAREYARLFKTGQYGRLYFVSGSHARGLTFRIFVLPADVVAIPNGSTNAPLNKDAVEVYGAVSGNPGWTEVYGWKHRGPWCDDFTAMVDAAREAKSAAEEQRNQIAEDARFYEAERIKGLLASY